ncbi:MAG TPA: helix-turn-helix domain-containing protein [Gemmataceae bacterium]|nr:helix-turn-helix domain-containing protein [Gemmataceae bacterium]
MPSGRKPDLERRRKILKLRDKGLTLHEIARRFGVSKQAIWSLLNSRPQRTAARAVACTGCGTLILSAGALRRDAATALCLGCLRARPGVPFSQRLTALRLAAGLCRAELAERSGVAPGSLRAYEEGRRQPQHRSAARLAAVVGDELLDGTDRKPAKKQLCDAS